MIGCLGFLSVAGSSLVAVGGVDEAAVEELIAAVRCAAMADARVLKAVAAVEDALPAREFAPMEIAAAVAWSRQAAASRLAFAHEFLRLRNVFSALATGEIDLPKARVFCEETSVLPSAKAERVCAILLPQAPLLTTGQLRAKLMRLVLGEDPDAATSRHNEKVASRRLVFEPDRDGCANLLGLDLPTDKARAAADAVHAHARLASAFGSKRTMGQLRADAFLNLLTGKPSSGRGGSVELTASLQTLAKLAETPGELAGYGPVIADIARKVAAQQEKACWTYTVHDTESGEVFHGTTRSRPSTSDCQHKRRSILGDRLNAPSAHAHVASPGEEKRPSTGTGRAEPGLDRRRATAQVARIVRARDRRCRAPGCRVPASRCDLDHRQDWAKGGRTEAGNLVALCRFHHRAKREGGWRYLSTKRGTYVWRSPLGSIYTVGPEPP